MSIVQDDITVVLYFKFLFNIESSEDTPTVAICTNITLPENILNQTMTVKMCNGESMNYLKKSL